MVQEKISQQEIEYIAKLARLELTVEEKKEYTRQLSSILDYFQKLSELNTENIKPTTYIVSKSNRYNEDQVRDSLSQKEVRALSPFIEGGYFKVPKILE